MYNLVILWQGDQGSGGLKEEINVRLKESKGPKFTNLYRGWHIRSWVRRDLSSGRVVSDWNTGTV